MPKTKEIWRSVYPFDSHYLDIDGVRMHYLDEQKGRVSGKEPREVLLMSHGNPTWSFFFRDVITEFRDRYRCVAVDHIGCGLSDKPSESDYTYRLEQRITDMCKLIEELDLRNITLVAHDWGGAVGMGAATRLPDRFNQLVLINTAAFLSKKFPFRIRIGRIPVLGRVMIQGMNLFCKAALSMASSAPGKLSKEFKAGLLAPYDNWHNRTAVYRFVADVPLSEKHPTYKTLKEIEDKLPLFRNKPVCLIWGMLDWCFPPDFLARFLQDYPEADVYRIEGAGHYVLEDAKETSLAAIDDFLKKHS